MSRFTSAYHVNRPSAQQLADRQSSGPAANLNNVSPPYTDDLGFPANASSNSHLFGHSNDLSLSGLPSLATLSETPTRMPNRTTTSVLGYNHSGRERSRQRASRWLILVIPPTFITESRGVLGHTLSSSPSSRLSQGLLLPLYPTMYAQLGAIAREFNFPSTVGICLYMHVNEAGALFTPRISEESWGILWGHLFEPNAPNPTGGLPISGRIEFDIDPGKARWYDSWVSASRRESASLPSLSPTHVASIHQRQESKTTDNNFEDVQEQNQTIAATKKRIRYTPKPLSLVERFDSANSSPPMPIPMAIPVTTSVPMPEPHPASPPLTKIPTLPPVPQKEGSLKSHREEIDTRIKSWRASATFKTNLLASTGQISLDPVNMPNTVPLDDQADEDGGILSEVNPEDYSWSITSAGPPSVLNSPVSDSSYRVPSVHVDRRVIGSVPLTPETCTSWGPEDYDPLSPVSSQFRLPSPDLGQRYLEYCPMTPTTATSWGPPSEYPPSPDPASQWIYHYRVPSLDLGQRVGWSRPVTPSTATSWGPPSEYPPSPPLESQWAYYRPPSVDLGRRAEGSRPVTPSTATSWGPPEEWPPTPTTLSRVSTPDAAQQRFSFTEEVGGLASPPTVVTPTSPAPWNLVWPYLTLNKQELGPQEHAPWKHVWPYVKQKVPSSRPQAPRELSAVAERTVYPVFKLYPAVYPHFDIYPSVQGDRADRSYALSFVPETPVIRTQGRTSSAASSTISNPRPSLQADRIGYPTLNIYPAVYPRFEIYPKIQTVQSQKVKSGGGGQSFKSYIHSGPKGAPEGQSWGFVWPWFQPVHSPTSASSSTPTFTLPPVPKSVMTYPVIKIYPAAYPFFDVYPAVERYIPAETSKPVPKPKSLVVSGGPVGMKLDYPVMRIYEAVYPHFDIYPTVARHVPKTTAPVRLPVAYPVFDIYPAVYPYLNIYPAIAGAPKPTYPIPVPSVSKRMETMGIQPASGYPSLVIYPSVYPWIDIYPSIAGEISRPLTSVSFRQSRTRPGTHARTKLRKRFTADEDAPPVPKLPDYATLRALSQVPPSPLQHNRLSIQEHAYPTISIYPPVYPYFDIYPAMAGRRHPQPPREEQRSMPLSTSTSGPLGLALVSVELRTAYPQFDIYPAVYPNFNIYPTTRETVKGKRITAPSTPSAQAVNTPSPSYPVIEIYKPVYPHFDIHPPWSRTQEYPRHNARAASTMGIPAGALLKPIALSKSSYPVIQIYNPVYPHFNMYPSWARVQAVPAAVIRPQKHHRELHQEVLPTPPTDLGELAPQPGSVHASSSLRYPAYPALELYKATYPHFNIYPSWVRALVPPVQDPPREKKARKSHKELHDEVFLHLPTTTSGVPENPPAMGTASRRPRGLTIVVNQQRPVEEPLLPSLPKVSPLRRRVPSSNHLNRRSISPTRPRVSPIFDNFPSIETRLSQSEDEVVKPPVVLTRSQSLSARPTTPKRRQSALIAQRIKALSTTVESSEHVFDRPVRGSMRPLSVSPTKT